MRRYPRTLRTRRNGRFNRNPYSGVRRTGRRFRNRIMRRALARRPLVPEIKFAVNSLADQTLAAQTNVINPITPLSIPQGTDRSSRIGGEVRFRKVNLRLTLQGPRSALTGTGQIGVPDFYVRILVTTPRIDYAAYSTYLGNITTYTVLDTDIVTVHFDQMVRLGVAFGYTTDNAGIINGGQNNGTVPTYRFMKKVFMFPRKVRFATTTDFVDEEKYSLFLTIRNTLTTNAPPLSYAWMAKTTYSDA